MSLMYYEDFKIEDEFISPSRTVTDSDISLFAGLTADYNPLHTNDVFAKKTVFGSRIAHGLLGASIAVGLWCRLGLVDGTALAFLETSWKFKNAIKLGDTIFAKIKLGDKRMTKSPDKGIIFLDFAVMNQENTVVQEGKMTLMVKARGTATSGQDC